MRAVAVAIVLSLSSAGASAQPAPPSTVFEGKDIFALQIASDPQVRPDGKAVAYVRASGDVLNDRFNRSIWIVDAATGAQQPATPGPGQASQPRWSPDGERLAYVASAEGEKPQLMIRWMRTGLSARVATLPEAPQDLVWSPDGRWLAFRMFTPSEAPKLGSAPPRPEGAKWAEPLRLEDRVQYRTDAGGLLRYGAAHLYVISADGGAPRQLTWGPDGVDGPASFTPDGRALVFSANRQPEADLDPEESELWRVGIEGAGEPVRLTTRKGPDAEPAVSPDGRLIAYTGYDADGVGHNDTRLYVMNADGSNPRLLTGGLDRAVTAPVWAADGRSIYVSYVDRAVGRLARIGLDGRLVPVAEGVAGGSLDRPYNGGSFDVAGGLAAFTTADASRPGDIAVAAGGGKARRITDLNAGLIAGKRLATIEPLKVTSTKDGKAIDAWLVLPPEYRRGRRALPLILEIHGGPATSYGPFFATDMQLYAAAGYAVLYANPRNSTSYGQDFARWYGAGHEPFADYEDLMSAVDAAVASGVADPENLFVTGGSYGGYVTGAIIGKTDRFKAAALQKPVVNWSSKILTTDVGVGQSAELFGKAPWEDPELYWKHSPLSLMGNVKTPSLVIVGERDYRTPPSEAEQYYAALKMRRVPSAYIVTPNASHGGLAGRPSQSAAKASAILAWFDRYRVKRQER